MPKVYIAAAFRRFSHRGEANKAYGEIKDPEYVNFLEKIEEVFLSFGFNTCLPHRDESMWGKVYYEPVAISSLCFRHIQTSDVVFALAETGRGVHIELGYAAALGNKKLIMMYNERTEPSTLIYGLLNNFSPWNLPSKGSNDTVILSYSDQSDLLVKLEKILLSDYRLKNKLPISVRTNTAIIDIGSHTVKLKILSHRPGTRPKILQEAKQSLGIMGDVIKTGTFSDETIHKVVSLLQVWKEECLKFSCSSIIVTGTAALRKASNANDLYSQLKKETSLDLEILSPGKELEYIFYGVQATFKPSMTVAVLNLGGGSTQLAIGNDSSLSERYFLEFGTREITERWPWNKPMTTADYKAILQYVREHIKQKVPANVTRAERIVHTGGELDFMLRCQLPLRASFLSPVHVSEISIDLFSCFSEEFSRSDPDKVAKNFGLDPAWASGAVASNAIALCAAEAVGAEAIIPSNINISDGLLVRN